jgi:hypothetical protein
MRDIDEQTVFEQGYKQAIELYNGISPETVNEMLESLKEIKDKTASVLRATAYRLTKDLNTAEEFAQTHPSITNLNNIITKAEREMKS